MTIRDAIYKAGEGGRIRLGDKLFEVVRMDTSLSLINGNEGYIFTANELTSLDWEAQVTDWVSDKDSL